MKSHQIYLLYCAKTISKTRSFILKGSALGAMVCQMTYGKRQWEAQDSAMRRILPILHQISLDLIPAIDADTQAFNNFMVSVNKDLEFDIDYELNSN